MTFKIETVSESFEAAFVQQRRRRNTVLAGDRASNSPKFESGAYRVVDTQEGLEQLAAELRKAGTFAFDTETTSLRYHEAQLVGISFSWETGQAVYVPVVPAKPDVVFSPLPVETVRRVLGPVFADPSIRKICHNAKYDMAIMLLHGMPVQGLYYDTMIAAWLAEPEGRGVGLKKQVQKRFGVTMTPIENLIGRGDGDITMADVSINRAAPYACADADYTRRLVEPLHRVLVAKEHDYIFRELEMPLVPVLMDMELHGMLVNLSTLRTLSKDIAAKQEDLAYRIYKAVGYAFNLNSPKQLGNALFRDLGLPIVAHTPTGSATSSYVLESLQSRSPVVRDVIQYRRLQKLKSGYTDSIPKLVCRKTGRVHTSFNQTATATGRLSSSNPNLQNIPVRTEEGLRVREAFIAPPGCVFLACDYSQIEIRLLAHITQDPELLRAFAAGEDIHKSTAAAVFSIPIEEVTKTQRSLAKTINFGLLYGMGAPLLAERTDLPLEAAYDFMNAYFERFKEVERYFYRITRQAHQLRYVATPMRHRRYFRPTLDENPHWRDKTGRAAINMPTQGGAAELIKLAMIRLHKYFREHSMGARLVAQVHDELLFEVPRDELRQTVPVVKRLMETAYIIDVPIKVDARVGHTWREVS